MTSSLQQRNQGGARFHESSFVPVAQKFVKIVGLKKYITKRSIRVLFKTKQGEINALKEMLIKKKSSRLFRDQNGKILLILF